MRASFWLLLPAIVLAASCAPAGEDLDPTLRPITLSEVARIDGTDADLVYVGSLGGVVILADGSIAVAQSQDQRVLFFDSAGVRLDSVGRAGSGPGEFHLITYLGTKGDSLWAWDPNNARVTVFDQRRQFVRTDGVPRLTVHDLGDRRVDYGFMHPRGMYPDGSLAVMAQVAAGGMVPGEPSVVTLRLRPDSTVGRVLAVTRHAGDQKVITTSDGSLIDGMLVLTAPLDAGAPDGNRFVLVRAPVEGPEAGTMSLLVVGMDGDTLTHRQYFFEPVLIPAAWVDSVKRQRVDLYTKSRPSLGAAFEREVHVPPAFPPYARVVIGNDGMIWLEERLAGPERRYQVFGPDGDRLGRVSLPANTTVSAVRPDYFWAVESDPDGVQSLVKYRFSGP